MSINSFVNLKLENIKKIARSNTIMDLLIH